jgi:hypothetical protein
VTHPDAAPAGPDGAADAIPEASSGDALPTEAGEDAAADAMGADAAEDAGADASAETGSRVRCTAPRRVSAHDR